MPVSLAGTMLGTSSVYKSLLKAGQQKKSCTVCNRHLSDQEMVVFEKYVRSKPYERICGLSARLLAQRHDEENVGQGHRQQQG